MANPSYMPLPHVLYTPHVVVLGHPTMRAEAMPFCAGTWLAYVTYIPLPMCVITPNFVVVGQTVRAYDVCRSPRVPHLVFHGRQDQLWE